MAWSFSPTNAANVRLYSAEDSRDAEASMFFYGLMAADADKGLRAMQQGMQSAEKWKGAIRMFTEFEGEKGNRITIPHVPMITGRGARGNDLLRGSGVNSTITTQDLYLDFFSTQVVSAGPLSENAVILDFLPANRPELKKWYQRTVEESILLALFGLTTWVNLNVLKNHNRGDIGETQAMGSDIETFEAGAISYAGDATSDATIDSADVLTRQSLSKLRTTIREGRTYPVEPMMDAKGKPCWGLILPGEGIEQLKADEGFERAFTKVISDKDNPLTQRADWYYDGFYIIEYEKCLKPLANVNRGVVIGADCLVAAKKNGLKYFVNDADDAGLRQALSVTGAMAIKADKVDGYRRNSHALDFYSASAA